MEREYLEFDEKLIKKIEEITNTDYDFKDCKVIAENCINIIEDLLMEYEKLQEQFNDFEAYVEDNYKVKMYWEE